MAMIFLRTRLRIVEEKRGRGNNQERSSVFGNGGLERGASCRRKERTLMQLGARPVIDGNYDWRFQASNYSQDATGGR